MTGEAGVTGGAGVTRGTGVTRIGIDVLSHLGPVADAYAVVRETNKARALTSSQSRPNGSV